MFFRIPSALRRKQEEPPEDDFDALIETHLNSLYRAALRYTKNESDAEDLVHDTVVRALRFRDRFEMGTNFKAWAHTILTNTFIHRYRRRRMERDILEGCSKEDVAQQLRSEGTARRQEQPETEYLRDVFSDEVVAALDALPEDYRQMVILCDLEGLSYKEIGEVVGCPTGTVMSRLFRARRQLEVSLRAAAAERGIGKNHEGRSHYTKAEQEQRREAAERAVAASTAAGQEPGEHRERRAERGAVVSMEAYRNKEAV